MPAEPTVAVGRVTRAHGVHGEVAVLVLSEVIGRFAPGSTVWLEDGRALTVASSRPDRDRVLVRFQEIRDRAEAEGLQRAVLVVPESASPALPDDSWWDHRIVGCSLETDTGRRLGTVVEVIHTQANDVWSAIDDSGAETLIPVLKDVLVSVDVESARIVVREIPGLTD